jgi:hypothetical protein
MLDLGAGRLMNHGGPASLIVTDGSATAAEDITDSGREQLSAIGFSF